MKKMLNILASFGDIAQHLGQLERFEALLHDFGFRFHLSFFLLALIVNRKKFNHTPQLEEYEPGFHL